MDTSKTGKPERVEKTRQKHPSKYNPETVQAILEAVERGLPFRQAASLVSVSPSTITRWIAERTGFAERIERSRAIFCNRSIRQIQEIGENRQDWKAAAWLLAKRIPEHFGEKKEIVVSSEHTERREIALELSGENRALSGLLEKLRIASGSGSGSASGSGSSPLP